MTKFEERASEGQRPNHICSYGQDHCPLPQEHLHLSLVPLPTQWTLGYSSKPGGIFWIVLYKSYMSLYFYIACVLSRFSCVQLYATL